MKLRNLVSDYLSENPCVDCGEADIIVLDFDHKTDKIKNIAEMIKNSCSINSMMNEIKKCEVRCVNCHRRKTARDLGNWRVFKLEGV